MNGSDVDNHAFSCGVHSSSKGFIRLTVAIGTPATIPSVDHAEITSHIVDNSNVILRALDLLVTRGAGRVVSTPDGLAAAQRPQYPCRYCQQYGCYCPYRQH